MSHQFGDPARFRADQIATLAGLVELPPPVVRALGVYEAAQQQRPALPQPGSLVRNAMAQAAGDIARRGGRAVAELDTSKISAAREADQIAMDQAELGREVLAAAARLAGEAADAHLGRIVAAIQAKHEEAVGELVTRARRLPPGATDATALEAGGQHREDYLRCRDLAAEAARLRDGLRTAEDVESWQVPEGWEQCLQYEQSGALSKHWLGRESTSEFGVPGTLEFWLLAAREDFKWWLPSDAQWRRRCDELRAEWHAQRVRAAAL
jgi:hypothetical protein